MNSTWLDQHRSLVFGVLSLLAVGGAGIFYWNQPADTPIEILPVEAAEPTAAEAASTPTPTPTATPAPVRVYVTGAVAHSDVYFLPAGSIIKDVIEAAGGLTEEADPERINQALELQDQQQIHIPRRDEASPPPPVQGGAVVAVAGSRSSGSVPISVPDGGGLVNLNTATLEQLDSLPGVGPAIAQRIIDYRDSVGSFASIDEITQVSGIGPATFEKIKALITVN